MQSGKDRAKVPKLEKARTLQQSVSIADGHLYGGIALLNGAVGLAGTAIKCGVCNFETADLNEFFGPQ